MRRKVAGYLMAAAMFLLATLPVCAAGNMRIVELKQKGDQLLAWVRDADSGGDVTASLGKTTVENVTAQTFQESGMEVHTLILVDNSLSIPEENRTVIQDRLLEMAAARRENEYFALGTISDQVTVLLEFTKDYTQFKNALASLEYQYQDTFLTDALYDYLIVNPFEKSENSFERILLISDGVDNKNLGYTKDELLRVLRDSPLPVYSLGIQNWNENNDQELENMFALSRAANGESLLLSDLSDSADSLISMLDADWDNLTITAEIPASIQDGSLQTLTLLFGEEGPAASLDNIRMPLSVEQEPVVPELEPEPEPTKLSVSIPLLIALGAVVIAVIILFILLLRKKKSPMKADSGKDESSVKPDPIPASPKPESSPAARRTVMVGGAADSSSFSEGRKTVRILNQRPIYSIMMKDMHNPDKLYQRTIEKSLIIGALPDSDICIDYDGTVSGRQCEIILEDGVMYLVNHSRSNITELNGHLVNQKMRLASGSIIKMGLVEMTVTFHL